MGCYLRRYLSARKAASCPKHEARSGRAHIESNALHARAGRHYLSAAFGSASVAAVSGARRTSTRLKHCCCDPGLHAQVDLGDVSLELSNCRLRRSPAAVSDGQSTVAHSANMYRLTGLTRAPVLTVSEILAALTMLASARWCGLSKKRGARVEFEPARPG